MILAGPASAPLLLPASAPEWNATGARIGVLLGAGPLHDELVPAHRESAHAWRICRHEPKVAGIAIDLVEAIHPSDRYQYRKHDENHQGARLAIAHGGDSDFSMLCWIVPIRNFYQRMPAGYTDPSPTRKN